MASVTSIVSTQVDSITKTKGKTRHNTFKDRTKTFTKMKNSPPIPLYFHFSCWNQISVESYSHKLERPPKGLFDRNAEPVHSFKQIKDQTFFRWVGLWISSMRSLYFLSSTSISSFLQILLAKYFDLNVISQWSRSTWVPHQIQKTCTGDKGSH